MRKKLVAYFSATGTTAKLAENLSEAIDADALLDQEDNNTGMAFQPYRCYACW